MARCLCILTAQLANPFLPWPWRPPLQAGAMQGTEGLTHPHVTPASTQEGATAS